ncbi:RDD family protein [Streptomyces sp. NPDC048442]|uniref:RDD family protein n=1 Tax=Streptomyces sp. NPDC048442 TaxID=3154823 RepID=UPI0034349E6B
MNDRFTEVRAPYATGYAGDHPLHQLATPWRRLGAFLLNELFLALGLLLLASVPSGSWAWTTALALYMLLCLLYSPVSTARWGGTPGKLVLGLRVVRAGTGEHLSFGRATGRFVAHLAFACVPLLGALNYLWCCGERSRCLHDLVADTLVVRVPAAPRPQ